MAECMEFPDTVEGFMDQYKIVDTEGIYMSKGSELVPIFRMMQWFQHRPERKKGKWKRRLVDGGFNADWHCSECGWKTSLEEHGYNFCPNCGSDNRE